MKSTAADFSFLAFPYVSPESIPLSFVYDGEVVHGLPASFHPSVTMRMPDANMLQYIIEGEDARGLHIRVEYVQYRDFPGTEWLAFFENRGQSDSGLVSDIHIVDGVLPCKNAQLHHGNGDTKKPDGYEWQRDTLDHPVVKAPADGTACNGAFPYMRLQCADSGVNIAVGWPAMWKAEFAPHADGVQLSIGQKRCRMVLHPGETMRTPRVNFLTYQGDEARGTNLWRSWYFAHILPRENGQPLGPKCCMHVYGVNGTPEHTGAAEDNQVNGLHEYLDKGIHPDIWWMDAGWYPCGGDWTETGDWRPDPERFPNGLTPLGKACDDNGIQLLLWFEPERVRERSPLAAAHPEWMLRWKQEDGSLHKNCLLNLGDRDCCDHLIELVDNIIKQSRVRIYRQDFNFDPAPYWEQAEADDRIGAVENLHVQGYLRYWDALIVRNPGLWIDSCASGGRRNDLETMRRAVPLHYTDVGYGNHPIKQKQHWLMFGWIPYFRAHNMNWYNAETGEYGTKGFLPDRFSYYAAMAPGLTDMLEHDASEADYALAREMQPLWRRAAELMLCCDYYPLTECRKSTGDWYGVQFHHSGEERGFVELIRNVHAAQSSFCMRLRALEPDARYVLNSSENGERFEASGQQLMDGIDIALDRHSAVIFFYNRK